MKNTRQQEQFRAYERNGQLVLAINSEILLPEKAPVRRTSAQLEELDYRRLYAAYSPKGRKSVVDPKVMFKVMAYGYECGIRTTRELEEACRYRVDFIWLLEDQPVPDHSTISRFRTGRCADAVEDLFYQYVKCLKSCGAKNPDSPKEIRVKKQLMEKRMQSLGNISSEEGIYLRMCRSIQVEGAFALLKNDFAFRRFLTRGKKNVKIELLFLAFGFNLKKNWMKAEAEREKTHLSVIKKTA